MPKINPFPIPLFSVILLMAATVQILEEEKPITKNKIPNTTKRNSLIIWFIQNIILMPIPDYSLGKR